mmetsp:Transcript_32436/g.81672  ORF Transcript_32436/g.81672 Transcript_32436/m.81672 type:complete len:202 (+) Transcript_32436:238-843(+)
MRVAAAVVVVVVVAVVVTAVAALVHQILVRLVRHRAHARRSPATAATAAAAPATAARQPLTLTARRGAAQVRALAGRLVPWARRAAQQPRRAAPKLRPVVQLQQLALQAADGAHQMALGLGQVDVEFVLELLPKQGVGGDVVKRARAQRRLRQRAHVVQDGVVGIHVGAPAGVVEPSRALAQVAAMPARVGASRVVRGREA